MISLNYTKKNSNVNMASTIHTACINGEARVNLEISGKTYTKFTLGVMDNLCTDVILGLDFTKEHEEVRFKLHSNKSLLEVDSGVVKRMDNGCLVMAANIDPPRIFRTVRKDCKPVVTKSRRYSKEDETFIKEEVMKLLKEGVIEPSNSSWRAQVLITKDERRKKRMVIDYSQTDRKSIYRIRCLSATPDR